jgi:hypothetical protein
MERRIITCVLGFMLLVSSALCGKDLKQRQMAKPDVVPDPAVDSREHFVPAKDVSLPMSPLAVGTLTTLRGYYDYQANGTPQHIRVNPANGNIHVTYMVADDSVQFSNSRGVAYAMSTDGGVTWNNFNQMRVPSGRRSGFPSIDLLRGSVTGTLIANHNIVNTSFGNQSLLYVDSPEGTGSFAEVTAPPSGTFAADQPIWPHIAGAADGSVVMHSSQSTAGLNWRTRTPDFAGWPAWTGFSGPNGSGGRNPTMSTSTGLVGTLVNGTGPTAANPADGGVYLYESTNNGITWGSPETVYPPLRTLGADTFAAWVAVDFTYDGTIPLAAVSESRFDVASGGYFYDSARVVFWSRATGVVTAVYHDTTKFVQDMNGLAQSNHLTVGGCTIAKSGTRIVIVFEGFQRETAASGFRYCDLWLVQSGNGSQTWTRPQNITNTPNIDERFPSLSKYNQSGFVNLTWQEETQPGSYAIATPDNTLPSVNWQKFLKFQLPPISGVEDESGTPASFKLDQNFPNPFNPTTKISYTIPVRADVKLGVYNVLGQEVATLVNESKEAGSYDVEFSAAHLSSGMYFYTLSVVPVARRDLVLKDGNAGPFSDTKKLLVVK